MKKLVADTDTRLDPTQTEILLEKIERCKNDQGHYNHEVITLIPEIVESLAFMARMGW